MEERELILLLKQSSKDAFTALYKQYWKQVYNFSRLYLTRADAVSYTHLTLPTILRV